jgi:transcriptional regulator with XRE-family HTH domain
MGRPRGSRNKAKGWALVGALGDKAAGKENSESWKRFFDSTLPKDCLARPEVLTAYRLYIARRQAGDSQAFALEQVANQLGVSASTVDKWMRAVWHERAPEMAEEYRLFRIVKGLSIDEALLRIGRLYGFGDGTIEGARTQTGFSELRSYLRNCGVAELDQSTLRSPRQRG